MAYLNQIPLFSSISYNELYHLSLSIKIRNFPLNTNIITQDNDADSLYILTSGKVEILINNKRVNILENGDYFGEIAILTDNKRTATVKTISDCTVLKLSTIEFKELIYDNTKII